MREYLPAVPFSVTFTFSVTRLHLDHQQGPPLGTPDVLEVRDGSTNGRSCRRLWTAAAPVPTSVLVSEDSYQMCSTGALPLPLRVPQA